MKAFYIPLVALVWACGPPLADPRPPRLVDTEVDPTAVTLTFDEPLARAEGAGAGGTTAALPVKDVRTKVPLPPKLVPGKPYGWTAQVEDPSHNVTAVAGRFYGPNDHPAALRLGEVRMAGSGAHPDFVELEVTGAGSLGGWTLEVVTAPGKAKRRVLADRAVTAGDRVLIYLKKPTAPGDASPTAVVELWAEAGGLSATKALVNLRPRPEAAPVDALAWALEAGTGRALSADPAVVEVDPQGSTATRTWCRTDDPDRPWMLVANGSATPGAVNRLVPWEPKPSSPGQPRGSKSSRPAGASPASGSASPGSTDPPEGPRSAESGPG